MKTYWLVEREHRAQLSRHIAARDGPDAPEWERCADNLKTLQEDRSRVYSPVTFQEVARRSVDNSPIKLRHDNRGTRSKTYRQVGQVGTKKIGDLNVPIV